MSGKTALKLFGIGASLFLVSLLTSTCSGPSPKTTTTTTASSPLLLVSPNDFWGNMKPIVSVKELMRDLIDPFSDYIFEAVKTDVTRKGVFDTLPKTQEDWDKIR